MVLLSSSYIFSWAALPSPAARGLHLLQHAVSTSSDVTVEQKRPAGVVGPVEEEGEEGEEGTGDSSPLASHAMVGDRTPQTVAGRVPAILAALLL